MLCCFQEIPIKVIEMSEKKTRPPVYPTDHSLNTCIAFDRVIKDLINAFEVKRQTFLNDHFVDHLESKYGHLEKSLDNK